MEIASGSSTSFTLDSEGNVFYCGSFFRYGDKREFRGKLEKINYFSQGSKKKNMKISHIKSAEDALFALDTSTHCLYGMGRSEKGQLVVTTRDNQLIRGGLVQENIREFWPGSVLCFGRGDKKEGKMIVWGGSGPADISSSNNPENWKDMDEEFKEKRRRIHMGVDGCIILVWNN